MKAYRFEEWQTEPRLQEVREPQPNAGEVLIKVAASGACHSDLHVMEWPAGQLPWKLPFTLGHEVTGRVVEMGPGVKGLETGEAVAVYGPWGCGRCRNCRLGMENYCEHQAEIPASGGGLGLDGGMAEYTRRSGSEGSRTTWGPSLCSTSWALMRRWRLEPKP